MFNHTKIQSVDDNCINDHENFTLRLMSMKINEKNRIH